MARTMENMLIKRSEEREKKEEIEEITGRRCNKCGVAHHRITLTGITGESLTFLMSRHILR